MKTDLFLFPVRGLLPQKWYKAQLNDMTMAFAEALMQEMSPGKESHGDM